MSDRENRVRFDAVALGETMLRLSVPSGQRLASATTLDVHVGGSESNVCASLASLGRRCSWVGALPEGPLGTRALRALHEAGIDASGVLRDPAHRMGLYFVEFRAAPFASEVHYDRERSAASALTPNALPWDVLLNAKLLHTTGITLGVSESLRQSAMAAMARCRAAGMAISFDVNYRSKLWGAEEAARSIREAAAMTDLFLCARADAELLFAAGGSDEEVLAQLSSLAPTATIVLTLGSSGSLASHRGTLLRQPGIPAPDIDRLGAGDAFAAGVIDGYLRNDLERGLRVGAALAALAISQHWDALVADAADLARVLESITSRIVCKFA